MSGYPPGSDTPSAPWNRQDGGECCVCKAVEAVDSSHTRIGSELWCDECETARARMDAAPPCPFCQSTDVDLSTDGQGQSERYSVTCTQCGAQADLDVWERRDRVCQSCRYGARVVSTGRWFCVDPNAAETPVPTMPKATCPSWRKASALIREQAT